MGDSFYIVVIAFTALEIAASLAAFVDVKTLPLTYWEAWRIYQILPIGGTVVCATASLI